MPAETNPMRNRNATVSSGRPFSSTDCQLDGSKGDLSKHCAGCTFVDGVDVWSLEPVGGVDQQVYWEESPLQLSQALSIRLDAAAVPSLFRACAFWNWDFA
jgi:hypothetical protein